MSGLTGMRDGGDLLAGFRALRKRADEINARLDALEATPLSIWSPPAQPGMAKIVGVGLSQQTHAEMLLSRLMADPQIGAAVRAHVQTSDLGRLQ